MAPSRAFHVTDVFEVVPCPEALNGSVPPLIDEAVEGGTVTEVTPLAPATVAIPDSAGTATVVATIMPVPLVAGAVKTPALVMVPIEAVQVTEPLLVAPWIAAINCNLPPGSGDAATGTESIVPTAKNGITAARK